MKFLISPSHISFFQKFGQIEFEDFISSEKSELLLHECIHTTDFQNKEKMTLPGRDLFRQNKNIERFIKQKSLGNVVSHLINQKQLRLAFDYFLHDQDLKNHFDLNEIRFNEMICVSNMQCIVILKLSEETFSEEFDPLKPFIPYPKEKNSVIFLKPTKRINLTPLVENGGKFLIMGFAASSIKFHYNEDPYAQNLIRMGYSSGDSLNNQSHPLIYKP
ncbi:MAG TPA: hypothetical protein P5048_03255 [Chlamydiales bacterium]|nr:hypothetical protein [Chlamydiales bacterium]